MSVPEVFEVRISRQKAELPLMIVALFICFVMWSIHYAIFGWVGGLVAALVSLLAAGILYFKLKGEYFIRVDENGIGWRQNLISKKIYIPWSYMMRVDYLVYEINFQIKESRQVVSFATSGLEDEQTEELKKSISAMVKRLKRDTE
jgi:hypothetical protein